jgi:hypothetical protein
MNDMPFVKFTTYGTLATELAMATLVFYKPFRKWVLLGGLMMHGYIEYSMNIPLFSFTMCSLYIAFYEGEEVTGWAKRMGKRLQRFALRVSLPAGMAFKPGPAAGVRAVDPLDLVSYEPGSTAQWQAYDVQDRPRNPFRASRQRSVGAWITYPIPGLWRRMLERGIEPAPEAPETTPMKAKKQKAGR